MTERERSATLREALEALQDARGAAQSLAEDGNPHRAGTILKAIAIAESALTPSATATTVEWLEDELMEVMRIVMPREDDFTAAIQTHAIRLLVECDAEKYEALQERWTKRHPEAEPLRTANAAKSAMSSADTAAALTYLHESTAPNGQWADQAVHGFVGAMLKTLAPSAIPSAEPHFIAPCPLPQELVAVLIYYDKITAKAPITDVEWDFVMTAQDWRELRGFFAKLKPGGPPKEIVDPPKGWTP